METLSCKTPEMNEKEIWVYFLAYNLIRLLMAQAALLVDYCYVNSALSIHFNYGWLGIIKIFLMRQNQMKRCYFY